MTGNENALDDKLHWYKDAIIYELHIKAFSDSNGDGIGDFNGLLSRLNYLQELGVTVIWLLPFYPSPLKDDDGCPDIDPPATSLVKLDGDRLAIAKVPTMDRRGLTRDGEKVVDEMAIVMTSHNEVTKWLIALAQPKQPDAQRLAQLIQDRLTKAGVAGVQVLGAGGPAKIGGVVQERSDNPPAPVCPAGKEVQQRQDRITPKATMQQRAVSAPPAAEPKKADAPAGKDDAVEIDMGN